MNYCSKCGFQNIDGATYCKACGFQIAQTIDYFKNGTQSMYLNYGNDVYTIKQPASSKPLVFGILALVLGGGFGLIFGIIALATASSSRRLNGPNGKATAGTILGAIGLALDLLIIVVVLIIIFYRLFSIGFYY